jgi:predicted ATP-binding protein involved in virulence
MMQEAKNSQAVYFKSLTIEGINCFKSEQTIDLTDGEGNPAMWTVILGNNNTGKTTLLRSLALLESRTSLFSNYNVYYPISSSPHSNFPNENNCKIFSELTNIKDWGFKKERVIRAVDIDYQNITDDIELRRSMTRSSISLKIDAYGTQRKQGKSTFIEYKLDDRTESLFKDDTESIINAEEWFLGIKFDALNGDKKAEENLQQIIDALVSILPDIKHIEVGGNGSRRLHFITNGDQRVLVNQLGSGYQSLITWVVDLAKRMFDRYPKSDNPLAEPAIVLVDEIDLHLHPEWQRKIVAFLRGKFPKTQFIVTAHSPLVVQSADDINVVVLQKDEETDEVEIDQPKITNFQGWSIEEILSDLMGMGAKIRSDKYLQLIANFNEGLDDDNYQQTKAAFEELKLILNPRSAKLELLKLQMASLAND